MRQTRITYLGRVFTVSRPRFPFFSSKCPFQGTPRVCFGQKSPEGLCPCAGVNRYRQRRDRDKRLHYISDEDYPKAAYYAMLARGHWGIENQLHWHLDVTFHEDACRSRKGFSTQNLSTLRKMALQIVKSHNDKKSIRKRLFRAALSQEYLRDLLLNAQF